MTTSFRIDFALRPLTEVQPWGNAPNEHLHWFGLTDGWYDVVIGGQHLFRVESELHGVDYYVVRLWEDLLDVFPAVVDELPGPLAERVADSDRWCEWYQRAWQLDELEVEKETALTWWGERSVYSHHLRYAPQLYLWRSGDEVHLRWRSQMAADDAPTWSSPNGEATIDVAAFIGEIERFDRELVQAMHARIDAVSRDWSRPDVTIDIDHLRQDHAGRASRLARVRTRPARHSWDDVVAAITTLESRLGQVRPD